MTDTVETVVPAVEVQPDAQAPENVPTQDPLTPVEEVILWNQTENNMSAGVALLNGDQLQVAVYQTSRLPKNLRPEMAPGLVVIKPGEGHLFKIRSAKALTQAPAEPAPAEPTPAEPDTAMPDAMAGTPV